MRPLNHKERKTGFLQFILVFSILILMLFSIGYLTLRTGEMGVNVLEQKHVRYSEIFRKKAALTYELEDIIKRLHQINNKKRNLSEHKRFQDLISDVCDNITESIKVEDKPEEFVFYQGIIAQIKTIQSDLDTYKEENEKYIVIEELLERCKEKYIENKQRENR